MIDESDARLYAALEMMTGNETPDRLANLRMFAGTASRLYRSGRRFWNWFFDTEYVTDIPPWLWSIPIALVVTAIAIVLVHL